MSSLAFATFWSGPLSELIYACLASFPARGVDLTLYCYDRAVEAPTGVNVRDAREICHDADSRNRYLVGGQPSLATFSDRFRYEMLARTNFCWIDADFLCLDLASLADGGFIWGRQPEARGKALINNALLKLPHDDPVLVTVLAQARAAENRDIGWGAIGPFLLTEIAERYGVDANAEEPYRFYPVAPDEFWRLLDPASRDIVEAKTGRSACVHLWSELLRRVGYDFNTGPPRGAYLYEKFAEIGMLGRFRRTYESSEIQRLIAGWVASAPAEPSSQQGSRA